MTFHRIAVFVVLLASFGLGGCFLVTSHSAYERIHDNQVTYDDFNDTMDFEPAFGADGAFPPLPVHEFDHGAIEDAGGYRAIDGQSWFAASLAERNDLLNDVEKSMPPGSVLVIEVATGDVWVIPPEAGNLDGKIAVWTEDEYNDLPDYVADTTGFGFYGPNLVGYRQLTALTEDVRLRPVAYIHPLARSALDLLRLENAIAFAPVPKWRFLTPTQRLGLLLNLQAYLLLTSYYGNVVNPFMFGISVPNGGIYAFREMAVWRLALVYAAYVWTVEQVLLLSPTGTPSLSSTLRRNEFVREIILIQKD